jgi:hypothetical protein
VAICQLRQLFDILNLILLIFVNKGESPKHHTTIPVGFKREGKVQKKKRKSRKEKNRLEPRERENETKIRRVQLFLKTEWIVVVQS